MDGIMQKLLWAPKLCSLLHRTMNLNVNIAIVVKLERWAAGKKLASLTHFCCCLMCCWLVLVSLQGAGMITGGLL
jgi:hypothetical protein